MVAFSKASVDHPSTTRRFRGQSGGGYDIVDCEVVSILGADCLLGERIADVALRYGYNVQALTTGSFGRQPHKNLRVLASDPFDARRIQTVVRGSTCVINLCNLSRWGFDANRPTSESITRNAIQSIKNARANRYICVTQQSVRMPGDRMGLHGLGSRYLTPLQSRHLCRDLQNEAELLARSKACWTLVRCPTIKDVTSSGTVSVDRHRPTGRFVALDRLARYLVHLKDSETYSRNAIFVASQPGHSYYR